MKKLTRIIFTTMMFVLSAGVSANKQVLVVMSAADSVELTKEAAPELRSLFQTAAGFGSDPICDENECTGPAGYFLAELALPLKSMVEQGYQLTFTSPNGDCPTMDPVSNRDKFFRTHSIYNIFDIWAHDKFIAGKDLVRSFGIPVIEEEYEGIDGRTHYRESDCTVALTPLAVYAENTSLLERFDAVFIPGGHAPMTDLADNQELNSILNYFHSEAKLTAAICHAPAALMSAVNSDGGFLYEGYKVTAISQFEEFQNEVVGVYGGYLTYYVDQQLISKGASYVASHAWASHIVADRELLTGQNPFSSEDFGKRFVEMLNHQ